MNISALIQRLVDQGIDPAEAGEILALAVAAGAASAPYRKSNGAIRTDRWRKNKASQTVTNRHTVTPERATGEASQTVTNRHKPSHCDNTPIEEVISNSKNLSSMHRTSRVTRGTRLSEDWAPDATDHSAALQLGLTATDVEREAARFRDYWIGKSGQGAIKVNWHATWRNWCRTTAEKLGRSPPSLTQAQHPQHAGIYLLRSDPRFDEWERVTGKSYPVGKGGGYYFPSERPTPTAEAM